MAKKVAKTAVVVDDLNALLRAGALKRLQGTVSAKPKPMRPKRRAKKRERTRKI